MTSQVGGFDLVLVFVSLPSSYTFLDVTLNDLFPILKNKSKYATKQWNCMLQLLVEMRRQRKMGHITIVGPSMGVVEAQLKVMLNEDSVNGQPAG